MYLNSAFASLLRLPTVTQPLVSPAYGTALLLRMFQPITPDFRSCPVIIHFVVLVPLICTFLLLSDYWFTVQMSSGRHPCARRLMGDMRSVYGLVKPDLRFLVSNPTTSYAASALMKVVV